MTPSGEVYVEYNIEQNINLSCRKIQGYPHRLKSQADIDYNQVFMDRVNLVNS